MEITRRIINDGKGKFNSIEVYFKVPKLKMDNHFFSGTDENFIEYVFYCEDMNDVKSLTDDFYEQLDRQVTFSIKIIDKDNHEIKIR